MRRWVSDTLLAEGQIAAEDLELFEVTDSSEAAVRAVVETYRREHPHRLP
jgi:predicted Rossmann-fold nucleotide-binding protein